MRAALRTAYPYLLLAPYLAVAAAFFCYPFLDSIGLAFHQTSGAGSSVFVGLDNFRFVLGDPDFARAVANTLIFTACSIGIQLPLSLLLAILLRESGSRVSGIARLVLYAPNLVGQIFVGILFSVLFMPRFGMVNRAIYAVLGWGLERNWLGTPSLVMPAIVITSLWMYVGFNMIYFLAALQNVDRSLIEAAQIDGAGSWQIFRHVTLPAIRPVMLFVVVTSTIGSLQLFELPFALLHGNGPANSGLTIVGYLYNAAFANGDLGTGAAVGWLLALIIFAIGLVQIHLSGSLRRDA